ncbi:hypothetical protein cyc_08894 [Cyclospora cayetanensis]|uniref:AP2/ERF domain-containing protein n=1 Tax=Cyclospora cayetanensis TaxID=88456 RepID=A0A1D3D2C0_9EIME|nr:hypothetical protein cyc_08894 [Cyclospora cayetanensis]
MPDKTFSASPTEALQQSPERAQDHQWLQSLRALAEAETKAAKGADFGSWDLWKLSAPVALLPCRPSLKNGDVAEGEEETPPEAASSKTAPSSGGAPRSAAAVSEVVESTEVHSGGEGGSRSSHQQGVVTSVSLSSREASAMTDAGPTRCPTEDTANDAVCSALLGLVERSRERRHQGGPEKTCSAEKHASRGGSGGMSEPTLTSPSLVALCELAGELQRVLKGVQHVQRQILDAQKSIACKLLKQLSGSSPPDASQWALENGVLDDAAHSASLGTAEDTPPPSSKRTAPWRSSALAEHHHHQQQQQRRQEGDPGVARGTLSEEGVLGGQPRKRVKGSSQSAIDIAPMPGVRFAKDRNSWVAFWCENGKQNYKSFSNKKFGPEMARLMAIAARQSFDDRVHRHTSVFGGSHSQYQQRSAGGGEYPEGLIGGTNGGAGAPQEGLHAAALAAVGHHQLHSQASAVEASTASAPSSSVQSPSPLGSHIDLSSVLQLVSKGGERLSPESCHRSSKRAPLGHKSDAAADLGSLHASGGYPGVDASGPFQEDLSLEAEGSGASP